MKHEVSQNRDENKSRKAKVSDLNRQESAALKAIWDRHPDLKQGEFGEKNGIGSQAAVGHFLNGKSPISMNAAVGFAEGLGCKISDFSHRLAEIAVRQSMVATSGNDGLTWPFENEVSFQRFRALPERQQGIVAEKVRAAIEEFEDKANSNVANG